jgi:hypothetical protein
MEQKSNKTTFESPALSTCSLQVRNEEGAFAAYTLVMDFNAIARAHEQLGLDLSVARNWQGLTGPQITIVCWCAFDRFHPEIDLRAVRQMLSPAQSAQVFNMLLELSFPGILERIAASVKDAKAVEEKAADPMPAGSL